ncbi:DUF4386 domain-containing protein [Demequina phytophila]|uniref:DUF4386 domain-containing protein n=1 Tax=Demequina phytophila TaxID=1638981 RepID=UPI0007865B65|nr:DUF4386 domain-containing protein [Demequina phytophila]
MSSDAEEHRRRSRAARTAGALYLAFVLLSILADVIGDIGLSDDAALARVIETAEVRFRAGLVLAMLADLLFLLAAWMLYVLLRPHGEAGALLFLVLNAVGAAVHVAGLVELAAALAQGGAGPVDAAIALHGYGVVAAQVFFGAWLVPLGILLLRSGVVPRLLGYLVLLDAVAVTFWFLQAMLLPDHRELSYPAWAVSFLAEVGLSLWLLVRGARDPATRRYT